MTNLLIVESRLDDFQQIEKLLSKGTIGNYHFQCATPLILKNIKKSQFDCILLAESYDEPQALQLLKKIITLKLDKPVIYLTDRYTPSLDQSTMQIGADDCLPISELTSVSLDRSIRHAIHRKNTEEQFAHLSTHDQLTGLANRFLFQEHLERTTNIAKRVGNRFSILFMNIDQFKHINDSLGHDMGDRLLIQVAERLKTCVRESDVVARFGNDEFAILLEDAGGNRNMTAVTTKIQNSMQALFKVSQKGLFITTRIGVTSYPDCGESYDNLLKSADSALSKAKELGRNKYYFFTGELNEQAKFKLELEQNLRRALINGEFDIHLQPQVFTQSQKVAGAEALLRWNHPKHGFISPAVFIPLLEELSLLPGVEAWVLRQVCHFAKNITDQYGDMYFCVNISGAHFKAGSLNENVFLALQSSDLKAQHLEIELTEDIMIEHVERNTNTLNELKALGVSIALDDFGKGYSSLSYLKNFPADILKIDKAFIDNIATDDKDAAIVEAMISLAHKLGLKVVAEGVEYKQQLFKLEQAQCDYIQGFYFAKPMPMDEFTDFVQNRNQRKFRQIN